jgi:peroxiredoxin
MACSCGAPADLPRSVDDVACNHLVGKMMPVIKLPSTSGRDRDLGALAPGSTVIFCCSRIGYPSEEMLDGWDEIPGAGGSPSQSGSFRADQLELADLGVDVFALSTQSSAEQREISARLRLPFELLSDAELRLAGALELPTFEAAGITLIKPLTLVIRDGVIEHVFYPAPSLDERASQVVELFVGRFYR